MSQATTWGVQLVGPAAPGAFAARAQDSLEALRTLNSGASRPGYATAHTPWLKVVSSTIWELYLYTGTTDVLIGTFNPVSGAFVLSPTGLGFATSAVARNDVNPLPLVNGRFSLASDGNAAANLRLRGRSTGGGDEAAIIWADGINDATRFDMLSHGSIGLRFRDGAGTEFLKLLASGDVNSKLFGNLSEQLVPPGTIVFGPFGGAPPGYVAANGTLVSRTTYARLWTFAQTYGKIVSEANWLASFRGAYSTGDGATTFRLPQLGADGTASEFVRFVTVDTGGNLVGLWQDSQNKSHSHGVNDPGHRHDLPNAAGYDDNIAQGGINAHGSFAISTLTTFATTGITLQLEGGSEARPRNVTMMALIKI